MKLSSKNGMYDQVTNFEFVDSELLITLKDNSKTSLVDKDKYIGYMDKGEGRMDYCLKIIIFILRYKLIDQIQ